MHKPNNNHYRILSIDWDVFHDMTPIHARVYGMPRRLGC